MSRQTKAISEELIEKCKLELKRSGIRGEAGRRLQAIISAKDHGISKVAEIYNISRTTLMRWIERFEKEENKTFATIQSGRGRRSILDTTQKYRLKEYIEKEGATLTSKKVQQVINDWFKVKVSTVTAYRFLKDFGFSYITPRPRHHKQNKSTQEEFKKKS